MKYLHSSSTKRYRSIFLSDFHMGAKSFDAPALLNFLKSTDSQYLFLVGDIIDGWKLKKRWYWTETCTKILDELVRKSQTGTKIIYLPGNHDDEIRRIPKFYRSYFAKNIGLKVREKTIHTMANGQHFLVMHGDQFDRALLRGSLSRWSDRIYDIFLEKTGSHASPLIKIGNEKKPFSLAKFLSKSGHTALKLLNNLERNIYELAKSRDVEGIICGHTHIPVIKSIKGIVYANSGCWLRYGHTALVETLDGHLKLIDWPSSYAQPELFEPNYYGAGPTFKILPDSSAYRKESLKIIQYIQWLWPVSTPSANKKLEIFYAEPMMARLDGRAGCRTPGYI